MLAIFDLHMNEALSEHTFADRFLGKAHREQEDFSGVSLQHFRAGELILREKQESLGAYLLIRGSAIGVIDCDSTELHISNYGQNQLFGYAALNNGQRLNHVSVRATEDCDLLFISTEALFSALKNEPELWNLLLANLSKEMTSVTNKMKIRVHNN